MVARGTVRDLTDDKGMVAWVASQAGVAFVDSGASSTVVFPHPRDTLDR